MAAVQPSSSSELQLFRVLQRANLLQYFETFITQGGDDVQQLCEAGEDEFLEIMALVGMASKPLHVRRLQKTLQEWIANPATFEVPKKYPTHVMSLTCSLSQNLSPSHSIERSGNLQDYKITPSQSSTISTSTPWSSQARDASPSDGSNIDDPSSSNSPQGDNTKDGLFSQGEISFSSLMSQPALLEHQISAIATAAAILAQDLPTFEPKSLPKKQISRDISKVMMMGLEDPNRLDAMRKYAAIYGRFDSKRKNHRPMSLHEISVNEAAAQLCFHIPALLTRREELFPLARQIVRDSGYHYSKGHSRYEDQGAAEVLVLPKQEQGNSVPSTSSTVPSTTSAVPSTTSAVPSTSSSIPSVLMSVASQEYSFNDLQSELTQITLDLSELTKEQNRIRSALRVLLEMNDHDQMKVLTAEMDDLNDRQTAMNKRRQRIVNTITKYRKGGSNQAVIAGTTPKLSPRDSPSIGQQTLSKSGNISGGKYNSGFYGYNDDSQPSPSNPLNTLYMAAVQNHKDSLFEEGLRIATQYGMSDFAQELIGMKSTKEEVDNKKESGNSNVFSGNSAFTSGSSPATFSVTCGDIVTSSSSHSVTGNAKCVPLLPEFQSLSQIIASEVPHFSGNLSAGRHGKKLIATHKNYNSQGLKNLAVSAVSEDSSESNDESVASLDEFCSDLKPNNKQASSESLVGQDNGFATTTITTKSGQVIEVETRRSSRKKSGDPDYYLINGGEKRFRSGSSHRSSSSSTSSERVRRLSSSSSASTPTPTAAAGTASSPSKLGKIPTHTNTESVNQNDCNDSSPQQRTKTCSPYDINSRSQT